MSEDTVPVEHPAGPTRRSLLIALGGGSALAALAACSPRGAAGAGPATSASTSSPSGAATTLPSTALSTTTAPTPSPAPAPVTPSGPASLGELAAAMQGSLVTPADQGYSAATRLFDPRFDGSHPAAVAYCATEDDVRRVLEFAAVTGTRPVARCGGHSYAGYSTGDGIVVDVSALNQVSFDAATGVATVGAGARLIDVYSALAAKGRAIPAGSCPSVGVSGLTLGGGIGTATRAHGLASDALTEVRTVLASADVAVASASEHAELFWASRGGGGGNFGVVTQFRFATYPTSDVTMFQLKWPWDAAADVLGAFLSWAPGAPDQLYAGAHLMSTVSSATPSISISGVWAGSESGAVAQLAALQQAAGTAPSSTWHSAKTFLAAVLVDAGCQQLGSCHLGSGGTVTRQPYRARSDYLTDVPGGDGLAALAGLVDARQGRGMASGGVAIDALGGAHNRPGAGDTAYVHRDAIASVQYLAQWNAGDSAAVVARNGDWLDESWSAVRAYASGQAYQNYLDPDLPDWQNAYYAGNYQRLVAVKRSYDPDRTFDFPQAIGR